MLVTENSGKETFPPYILQFWLTSKIMSVFNFLIYKLSKLTIKVRNSLTDFSAIEEAQKSAKL